MKNSYKFPIAPCDRPSEYRDEALCKVTVMNLARQELQAIVDRERLDINVYDFKFHDWDFKEGFVNAVYNPMI